MSIKAPMTTEQETQMIDLFKQFEALDVAISDSSAEDNFFDSLDVDIDALVQLIDQSTQKKEESLAGEPKSAPRDKCIPDVSIMPVRELITPLPVTATILPGGCVMKVRLPLHDGQNAQENQSCAPHAPHASMNNPNNKDNRCNPCVQPLLTPCVRPFRPCPVSPVPPIRRPFPRHDIDLVTYESYTRQFNELSMKQDQILARLDRLESLVMKLVENKPTDSQEQAKKRLSEVICVVDKKQGEISVQIALLKEKLAQDQRKPHYHHIRPITRPIIRPIIRPINPVFEHIQLEKEKSIPSVETVEICHPKNVLAGKNTTTLIADAPPKIFQHKKHGCDIWALNYRRSENDLQTPRFA